MPCTKNTVRRAGEDTEHLQKGGADVAQIYPEGRGQENPLSGWVMSADGARGARTKAQLAGWDSPAQGRSRTCSLGVQ
jgi:hypothetical protein